MKQTINYYQFEDAFRIFGVNNSFSYHGLKALFNYLEEYEEETGAVAINCEFDELTAGDIILNYQLDDKFTEYCVNNDIEEPDKEDAMNDFVRDYLTENTLYLGYVQEEGTHLYASF